MYTPLNIKTENSILSSLIKIDDLILFANKNNIKSLTITDNKMYGVYYFYKKCKESGIKPIVGLEVLVDSYKVILYCKNYDGYRNLLHITSNDIDLDILKKYSSDLICIVPFESMSIYDKLSFYDDIFIGYKNSFEESSLDYDNLVYMNEILCLDKKDLDYLRFLSGIREGVSYDEVSKFSDNYLMLFDSVRDLFPRYLSNNYKIYDMCDLEIQVQHDLLPRFDCPDGMDSYSYLKKL